MVARADRPCIPAASQLVSNGAALHMPWHALRPIPTGCCRCRDILPSAVVMVHGTLKPLTDSVACLKNEMEVDIYVQWREL